MFPSARRARRFAYEPRTLVEKILHRQWRDQQARTSNADCSPNGADLQDTIRNGDVVQVRQRNEFEKSNGGEKGHDGVYVIPAARRY